MGLSTGRSSPTGKRTALLLSWPGGYPHSRPRLFSGRRAPEAPRRYRSLLHSAMGKLRRDGRAGLRPRRLQIFVWQRKYGASLRGMVQ
jgi:hypothetical protein